MAADDTPTTMQGASRAVELVAMAASTGATAQEAVQKPSEAAAAGGAAKVTAAGAAMLGTLGSKMNAAMTAVKHSTDGPGAGKRTAAAAVGPARVAVDAGQRGGGQGGARLDRIFAALDAQAKAVPVVRGLRLLRGAQPLRPQDEGQKRVVEVPRYDVRASSWVLLHPHPQWRGGDGCA